MGLNFNYSDYGKVTDSNTLYSIRLSRSRLKTSATNYGKFGTIEGVTLGKTTIEELRQMGLKVASHGDRNEYTYGELGEYRFYNDRNGGNIVEDLTSYKNLLPHEWVASGESRIMTYNKWLACFAQIGFVVIKDEVADRPDAAYPGLRAVNNTLGLQLDVDFNKFSSVASEGDDAAKVRGFNIRTI